jgi:hypothetical protein
VTRNEFICEVVARAIVAPHKSTFNEVLKYAEQSADAVKDYLDPPKDFIVWLELEHHRLLKEVDQLLAERDRMRPVVIAVQSWRKWQPTPIAVGPFGPESPHERILCAIDEYNSLAQSAPTAGDGGGEFMRNAERRKALSTPKDPRGPCPTCGVVGHDPFDHGIAERVPPKDPRGKGESR